MSESGNPSSGRPPQSPSRAMLTTSPVSRPVVRRESPAPRGIDAGHGLTPRRILDAILYWWKAALPAGVVLALVGAAVVLATFEKQYEASAWIRIEQRAPFVAFPLEDDDRTDAYVETQVQLLRSPKVLQAVMLVAGVAQVREIAEQRDPVRWLQSQIRVKVVGKSELHTVSFQCSDPKAAALVVNAVMRSYFKLRDEEEAGRVKGILETLKEEEANLAQTVNRLRSEANALAKSLTGKDLFLALPEQVVDRSRPFADSEARLIAAQVEVTMLEAELKALEDVQAQPQEGVAASVVDKAVLDDHQVMKQTALIQELNARLSELELRAAKGKADPAYQKLAKEVAEQSRKLDDLKLTVGQQAKEQLKATRGARHDEQVAELQLKLARRRTERDLWRDNIEAEKAKELKAAGKSGEDILNLKFKQEELARTEKLRDVIAERALQLKTEQNAPPRVRALDDPVPPPTEPVQGLPYRNLMLVALGSLCAPFGLAILKEQLTRRVTDSEHLEQQAHLTVIGEIARLPSRSTAVQGPATGRRLQRAVGLFEESVDALRTNLLLSMEGQPLRILAITSAVSQEGKTSVAVQLAVSIARATHEPTLLIDGDLRSPSVHRVFDLPLAPGFTKVLAGKCPVEEAIVPTGAENVDVLPAGELSMSPHRLLGNGNLDTLLRSLPAKYRYIVVDTPPVLAASESLILARSADAFLMCAMRNVSRLSQVEKATERLTATGGRLAGTVLSGVPVSQYVRRYGTYYPSESTE